MLYCVSILNKKYFARMFGLDPKIHIKYNLSQLEKKDKVRLNYFLSGKRERDKESSKRVKEKYYLLD